MRNNKILKIKKKIIFCFGLLLFLSLVSAYNYSQETYGYSYYGTGYYIAPEQESASTTTEAHTTTSSTGGGGYISQIYYADEKISTAGDNFYLKYNDKIKFVIQLKNHTLTMDTFNHTTADVKIESELITAVLEKGISKEFDLNNDKINDLIVRYDGINNSKAAIFIQEITRHIDEEIEDKNQAGSPLVQSIKDNTYLILDILIILITAISLLIFFNKRLKKKRHLLYGY